MDDRSVNGAGEEEGDLKLMDILFQFIPYYGQGDPSNDSTVRATLSSLSIEDIDSKDEYGNTLLLLACSYRCEDLVRIMLNKGADPNATNATGACCLHFACYAESCSLVIAKYLINNGANPEVVETSYGCTPLHYCGSSGNVEIIKLLLANGAQIGTVDFYNYTAVDYARQANMADAAVYLQQQLDKHYAMGQQRAGFGFNPMNPYGGAMGGGGGDMFGGGFTPPPEWMRHFDPASGSAYYIHAMTGESVWEADLRARLARDGYTSTKDKLAKMKEISVKNGNGGMGAMGGIGGPSGSLSARRGAGADGAPLSPGIAAGAGANAVTALASAKNGAGMVSANLSVSQSVPTLPVDKHAEATKNLESFMKEALAAILVKHDMGAMADIENTLASYKGKEIEMLSAMYTKYNIPKDVQLEVSQKKIEGLKKEVDSNPPMALSAAPTVGPGSARPSTAAHAPTTNTVLAAMATAGAVVPPAGAPPVSNGIDVATVTQMMNEEKQKFEQQLMAERNKFEAQLAAERTQFRENVGDKEGNLSKLTSEVEALKRENSDLKQQLEDMSSKATRLEASGGEAVSAAEAENQRLQAQVKIFKSSLAGVRQENQLKQDKITSLENTLASLTSGNEERIAQEKAAAEEREKVQRERDATHSKQLEEMENQKKEIQEKAKRVFMEARAKWKKEEETINTKYESYRKSKETELEALRKEFSEKKADFAQQISAANMESEHNRKAAEEALGRARAAEEAQKGMAAEIAEARTIQGYNAQLHKDLGREQLARKRLHNEMEDMKGRIRVYVRIRPMARYEQEKGCSEAAFKDGKMSMVVKGASGPDSKKVFDFDQVFGGKGDGNTQPDVFRDTKHLVMSVLDGYNVCILAYGQTGSGKTYTMIGSADIGGCMSENGDFDENAGITPRAVSELFRLLNERNAQITYEVDVQMFQLYRDSIDDLLASGGGKKGKDEPGGPPLKVTLAEHSSTGLVSVEGAATESAQTPGDVMRIFAKGSSRRTTASTRMNAESSRSHLICCLVAKMTNRRTNITSVGKLTLVDLAGSERVDKSGAQGEVLKEAQSINKSLSALGDVIAALTSGQNHIPYRNHPLTMLMSDSIGGNSKTLIFINTSPADYNAAETVSSLNFGTRCKDITNSVQQGPGVQVAQMAALKKELAKMKKGGGGRGGPGLSRPG